MNGEHFASGAVASANGAAVGTLPLNALSSNRVSPFPATTAATKNFMAAPSFLTAPGSQSLRSIGALSQASYSSSALGMTSTDRDATVSQRSLAFAPGPIGGATSTLIRRLPRQTSEGSLRLMMVFSKDLINIKMLPPEQSEDAGFVSAILKFRTPAGAVEAKNMLDGKPNIHNDAHMIVEILGAGAASLRYPIDTTVPNGNSTATSSSASSSTSSRQPSRFNNGGFSSMDKVSPPMNGSAVFGSSDLTSPDPSAHYQSIFSPQSPIGNHLTDRAARITGKSLINDAADDDETGELLKDAVGYADNTAMPGQQRGSIASHLPIGRMSGLSLNTAPPTGPASMQYGHPIGAPHAHSMSPSVMGPASATFNPQPHFRGHNFPPVNPADQNPPCNTLYVGNLPIDTSEEELKAMFSKQRGYKRLCFRTKQNGPMCFVEFEDVSFATKALHELYGSPLHNSVKGGIRLSFSKNPLGVRSGQPSVQHAGSMGLNSMMSGSGNAFTTAHGPPPGLSTPHGSRGSSHRYGNHGFHGPSSNSWNVYNNGPSIIAGAAANYPPHMMGR